MIKSWTFSTTTLAPVMGLLVCTSAVAQDQPASAAELKQVQSDLAEVKDEPFRSKPAEDAGFERGDVVVKYGNLKIDRARTLARAVLNTEPGTKVLVEFYRGETLFKRSVTVRER